MNNEAELAVSFYSQTPKQYNCAQAVPKAFGRDDLVDALKPCGGGKAPGGMCGALYAATLLLPEGERETITQQFQAEVGHTLCKLIRQENKTKCADCVRIAAELLAGMKK
jgi:hypothetical protein